MVIKFEKKQLYYVFTNIQNKHIFAENLFCDILTAFRSIHTIINITVQEFTIEKDGMR